MNTKLENKCLLFIFFNQQIVAKLLILGLAFCVTLYLVKLDLSCTELYHPNSLPERHISICKMIA